MITSFSWLQTSLISQWNQILFDWFAPKYLKCSTLFRTILSCILSFGWFPGVWTLCADVAERSVCYIFIHGVSRNFCLHINFRRRGVTQRKEYKFQKKVKIWNKKNCHLSLCCDAVPCLLLAIHKHVHSFLGLGFYRLINPKFGLLNANIYQYTAKEFPQKRLNRPPPLNIAQNICFYCDTNICSC